MAMILDAFIGRLNGLLVQLVEEKVTMLLGVDDEIDKLRSTLATISTVLADAETKRIENKAVNLWLKKLKDVMYDADDIVDLCRIEADKYPSSTSSSSSTPPVHHKNCSLLLSLSSCFPLPSCFRNPAFAYTIGTRIKDLNSRLKMISKEKDEFGLLQLRNNLGDDVKLSGVSDRASSLVETYLVGSGVHEDTEKLVGLLTRQDARENVLVLAIVGMGGIGKTTRAQLIFNDDTIKSHFELKIWISVSTNFDEDALLREVISGVGGDHSGAISKPQLVNKLVDAVSGKKFMLVLDDVWEESAWDRLLRNPLSRGAVGSRVLVTTRNEEVAKRMKAVDCHHVEELTPEDGWSLLRKKLVLSGEEEEIENLKDIGLEIVNKCGGLPLAINAMGGVMCTKKSRRDWQSVLESSVWSVSGLPEQVNRALYLSYLHLPSHLKQCFLYCLLLPKDWYYSSSVLIQLWIAEGLIKEHRELSISMEDTGEQYYGELIWRSMLQSDTKRFNFGHKMHDLQRSIAEFLAQDESLLVKAHDGMSNKNRSSNLRRISIDGGEMQQQQLDLLKSCKKSLRTLFLMKNLSNRLNGVIDRLPFLRVLDLRGSQIEELPDSLTSLAHLRYLGLSSTPITRLPETIGGLKNLQSLDLENCQKLSRLPNSIMALKNLRGLDIAGTAIKGIPAGIESLHHLSNLFGYILQQALEEGEIRTGTTSTSTGGGNKWSALKELGPLLQLRELEIVNLERVSHCMEARRVALSEKHHLTFLILGCTDGWMDEAAEVDLRRTEEVFNLLQPPYSCLKILYIDGFPGCRFPNWMTSVVYPNLRTLWLRDCKFCQNLPPLGHLPNLVHLIIQRFSSIKSIGAEFMGTTWGSDEELKGKLSSTAIAFPKLQYLTFIYMTGWENWEWETKSHAMMPRLQKLVLDNCPKLISLPVGLSHHATALTKLWIVDCDSLDSVGKFCSLQKLKVVDCYSLKRIFNLPILKKLVVRNCPSLIVVENLGSLKIIQLKDYKMETLPQWLLEDVHSPKSDQKLVIYCNQQLFQKICQKEEEEWSKIQHTSHVEIHDEYGILHESYTKVLFSFTSNFSASTSSTGASHLSSTHVSAISADPIILS